MQTIQELPKMPDKQRECLAFFVAQTFCGLSALLEEALRDWVN